MMWQRRQDPTRPLPLRRLWYVYNRDIRPRYSHDPRAGW